MNNVYSAQPWMKLYGSALRQCQAPPDVLSIFNAALQRDAAAPALRYFDCSYSYEWLAAQSDALAVWLADEGGVRRGDRVAIILQNVPQFVIAAVACWKLGAVPMPCNPMYKEFELAALFADGTPAAVICHRQQGACVEHARAAAKLAPTTRVVSVCPRDLQGRHDGRVLPDAAPAPPGTVDFAAAIAACSGRHPPPFAPAAADTALLLYTSGTTGIPKGAVISHRALAFDVHAVACCSPAKPGAAIFGLAPLFHITGFSLQMGFAFHMAGPLVLFYRFEPRVALDALREWRPSHVIGAITAYIALMNAPGASPAHFAGPDVLISGGAPVPPSVVEQFAAKFGRRIRSGYGMTELSGASHLAPRDSIPVDAATGALAVGVPLPGVQAEVRDEEDRVLPVGEAGELVIRGSLVMDGYRNQAEETAVALRDGWMHTGDVAFMDSDGWFYLVDRKKDMISASGFKVWPREVEDVLYQHPGIREAAVVGVPDAYRGESVLAFVALVAGADVAPPDLIRLCRERLAAYKVPRRVEIVAELPKTVTGKIMRAELRRQAVQFTGS